MNLFFKNVAWPWLLAWLAVGAVSFSAGAAVTVSGLRCEDRQNPEGIDVAQPRLSWIIESTRRGEVQTAY